MSVKPKAGIHCGRCKKAVAAKAVNATKDGPRCKKCSDRMPPHLRKHR